MITWRDVTAIQERHQDLLREAEKEQQIRQARAGSDKVGLWQHLSDLVFGVKQERQPAGDKAQDRKRPPLAGEAV